MHDTLMDIRDKLNQGSYRNEEHVRANLVMRVLEKAGWNIWDPEEVCAEFLPVRNEDTTKVDLALFAQSGIPSVYIEVKAVGRIDSRTLPDVERQIRDYNRNNTALFSIITDGRTWRFYYSQTGGEFSDKCFKQLDLLDSTVDDAELALISFLHKDEIVSGSAKEEAEKYLRLTRKQRVIQDSIQEAQRISQENPYPSWPQALAEVVKRKGYEIPFDEAGRYINEFKQKPPTIAVISSPPPPLRRSPSPTRRITGDVDLRHTIILEGCFAGKNVRNWNELVETAITIAVQMGKTVSDLRRLVPVKEGAHTGRSHFIT